MRHFFSSVLDPIAEIYLKEALETFCTANYLASTVMIGVAPEQIMELFIELKRGWGGAAAG